MVASWSQLDRQKNSDLTLRAKQTICNRPLYWSSAGTGRDMARAFLHQAEDNLEGRGPAGLDFGRQARAEAPAFVASIPALDKAALR